MITEWEEEAPYRFGEDQTLVPKVPGKSLAEIGLIIKSRLGWEQGRDGAGLAAMLRAGGSQPRFASFSDFFSSNALWNPSSQSGRKIRPQHWERTFGGRKRSLDDPHHIGLELALSRAPDEEKDENVAVSSQPPSPSSGSQTVGALHHRFAPRTASSWERLEQNDSVPKLDYQQQEVTFPEPVCSKRRKSASSGPGRRDCKAMVDRSPPLPLGRNWMASCTASRKGVRPVPRRMGTSRWGLVKKKPLHISTAPEFFKHRELRSWMVWRQKMRQGCGSNWSAPSFELSWTLSNAYQKLLAGDFCITANCLESSSTASGQSSIWRQLSTSSKWKQHGPASGFEPWCESSGSAMAPRLARRAVGVSGGNCDDDGGGEALAVCSNSFAPPPVGAGLPPGSEIRKGEPHRILQGPILRAWSPLTCSLDRDSTEIQDVLEVWDEWITLFQKTKLGVRIGGTVGGIVRVTEWRLWLAWPRMSLHGSQVSAGKWDNAEK